MADGNVNSARGVKVVEVDRNVEMALYDNLPRRWRELIGSLPILQQIAPILQYRAALGEEHAFQEVVKIFSAKFPGWEPPVQGAPVFNTGVRACRRRPVSRRTARVRRAIGG